MLKPGEKTDLSKIEEDVLKFWAENQIFEKTIAQRKKSRTFSFYDGPPFATGLPHYGHILATTIKDSVTRFWTMRGFKVERRVGWDCHGLPVENLIEKELGLRDKKAVLEMGMENFNNACRAAVFRSVGDFQKTLQRVGRWADYENSYATLDNDYMESVWWVFKQLWDQGLVYSDYRVAPYCPRCGTPLANFEVNQGYKDTDDPAIYVKFEAAEPDDNIPTYFLAWTTTPWTLTANAALAVGPDIKYAKVAYDGANGKEFLIMAKDRVSSVMEGVRHDIVAEYKGKDLKGKKYRPIFDFAETDEKAHFVVTADYVLAEDGSGIVHTAPAFGVDDMETGKKNGLPMILTVNEEGKFKPEVTPWAGMFVKKADKEIIEHLKLKGILFKEGTIRHSYPFCWRCDTPLLYYPIEGWYVSVTKIKEDLLKNNTKTHWVPSHLKNGRFGKWLADVRDWAISRNRFWGAPIPVWKCDDCGEMTAVGSLKELNRLSASSGNKYFIMRHGESDSNVLNIFSSLPEKTEINITKKGIREAEKAAKELKQSKIDVIYTSPLRRTMETAQILADKLKVEIIVDERLAEYSVGEWNGKPVEQFEEYMGPHINKFEKTPEGGENLRSVRARMISFMTDIDSSVKDKNILIISHGDPLWVMEGAIKGYNEKQIDDSRKNLIQPGEWRKIKFSKLPFSRTGELDLHRPYIDETEVKCPKCNGKAKRINQVFDCWFESGSMPYASWHYPFENKKKVEEMFPADFIAEGLDQTRGWFYTLHVLASALTKKDIGLGKTKPAFKNVIVNGLVLDEFGRKLSKKLRNYTEPEIVFDKYGADAVRFFLLSSTSIGEDYRFADKGVLETKNKIVDRFLNSYNFLRMYANGDLEKKFAAPVKKESIADRWIKARLDETIIAITKEMELYELTDATRPIINFLDDFSNWYIRRSRTRLQRPDDRDDSYAAGKTMYDVLITVSKLLAPFSPFISEAVYLSLTGKSGKKSVHLEDWPKAMNLSQKDKTLIRDMAELRVLTTEALARRSETGIKVKQPLMTYKFSVKSLKGKKELLGLLADEVNVKKVIYDEAVPLGGWIDNEITTELKAEGLFREAVRSVQDLRQKAGLNPGEQAILSISGDEGIIRSIMSFEKEAMSILSLQKIEERVSDDDRASLETKIDGRDIRLGVRKA
ncbi:MAG: class I tRNA ligase family protein [Candidatus Colwellbacteria bacterium]|nr:class I tRNA ligase family protein [Candidatus Colwellbacteria bacterium]